MTTTVPASKAVDLDTGSGVDLAEGVSILLPANGGAVIAGTATNPLRTDPTGTTAQPVTQSGSWSMEIANDVGNPIPVNGTVTITDGSGPVTVDGTITANLGTIGGAATETTLAAINTKIPSAPATDRTTAAAPFAVRFSDGTNFVSFPVDRPDANAPGAVRLSDGTNFYKATTPADTQPVSIAGTVPISDAGSSITVDDGGSYLTVENMRSLFRDNFITYDTTNNWDTVQTGSGMTITRDGAANGASYVNVATGTTINAETILLSKQSFPMPLRFIFALSMSQRIANQSVYVELVGVDGNGNIETDVTYPSTDFANATNGILYRFDGTTATTVNALTRADGISPITTVMSSQATTAASGGSPNFLPAGYYQIDADFEQVMFSSVSIDSVAVGNTSTIRTQSLPNPAKRYKIRVRIVNGASAPASTTNVRLHFVRVLDAPRILADNRYNGRTADSRNALPVLIAGSATSSVQLSVPANGHNVQGGQAVGASAGANPVRIGGTGRTAQPTAVTDNQVTNVITDKVGRSVAVIGHVRDLVDTNPVVTIANTTEASIVTAVAATFLDLHAIEITNTSTVDVRVDIRNATGGSILLCPIVKANSTFTGAWDVPKKQAAVNNAWTAQLSATPTGGDVRITTTIVRNI